MESTDATPLQEKKLKLTLKQMQERAEANAVKKQKNREAFDKNTKKKKKDMLEALETELGIVAPAAKVAKINRSTHYRWIASDEIYKRKVEELSERTIDFVENSLMKSIKGGNVRAQIFYLNTKGKKRGYVPKTETEHSGSTDHKLEVEIIEVVKKEDEIPNDSSVPKH